jgi:putative membrane protein
VRIAANIAIAFVALEHFWILVLEMLLWTNPLGRRTFGLTPELAQASKVLAMNQGLYNGFLAAGLVWSLVSGLDAAAIFFLVCVIVAGIFGAFTAKRSILWVQAAPAAAALLLELFAR